MSLTGAMRTFGPGPIRDPHLDVEWHAYLHLALNQPDQLMTEKKMISPYTIRSGVTAREKWP